MRNNSFGNFAAFAVKSITFALLSFHLRCKNVNVNSMTEAFLHYIWEFQYFNKTDLKTISGESVSVVHPGYHNTHSGPDFFNARIKIDGIEWIGNVEIHIDSSGWIEHHHETDAAYDSVILHVVWGENKKINRTDGTELPTIELKNRVSEQLLIQYRKLVNNPEKIPCAIHFPNVSMLTKYSMMDKALMQRLETKAKYVDQKLQWNGNDWEQTSYELLCRNFGFKVNADPFEQLSKALPYKIVLKHSDQLHQVEALLFGQAGFLDEQKSDGYLSILKREYYFLSQKYLLSEKKMSKSQWKFLRLRPANFPTVRIAQLASLLAGQKNIFARMVDANRYADLLKIFSVSTSEYWKTHYQFLKPVENQAPSLGEASISNIIINTTVPLMVAYGKSRDEQEFVDRAVDILQHISGEDNTITKTWTSLGIKSKSAADSQALIELHNNFCMRRRCLDCSIGFSILQPA